MIINITDSSGSANYNVDAKRSFKHDQSQAVEYIVTTNGQTQAFNRGATYDKFTSSFTITGLKDDIFELSKQFKRGFGQLVITAESGELIFGAGIDYSNTITCNLLNSGKISYPQSDFVLAEIPIKVEALVSNGIQLAFKSGVSAVLPTLNYQTTINRVLGKNDKPHTSAAFGDYGTNIEVDESGEPINNFTIDLTFIQNEEQTAQIEKFYNTQRSTPFLWPALNQLDLFEGQETDNVMITELSTNKDSIKFWTSKMRIVANV
jgi:hypothetical protein